MELLETRLSQGMQLHNQDEVLCYQTIELSGTRYGDQGQFLPNATDNAKAAKINHNAVLL